MIGPNLSNLYVFFETVYEATGKSAEGLSGGNLHSVGLFDQCLDVQPPQPHNFVGRYITVYIAPMNVTQLWDNGQNYTEESSERKLDMQAIRDQATHDASERRTPIALLDYLLLLANLGSSNRPLSQNETESLVADSFPLVLYYPSVGFCLPSSCSAVDLRSAVNEILGTHLLGDSIALVTVTDDRQSFSKIDPADEFDGATIAVM